MDGYALVFVSYFFSKDFMLIRGGFYQLEKRQIPQETV